MWPQKRDSHAQRNEKADKDKRAAKVESGCWIEDYESFCVVNRFSPIFLSNDSGIIRENMRERQV